MWFLRKDKDGNPPSTIYVGTLAIRIEEVDHFFYNRSGSLSITLKVPNGSRTMNITDPLEIRGFLGMFLAYTH